MAFEELKQRQAVMWGTGPYQNITETIADVHALAVERLDPRPGDRWLDLATGTGAVAELAARAGAAVTAVDLAPALIETARQRAAEQGLEIDYRVGDCERLELEDASFDKVSSTCGVMFAPDHEATARELARVTASGGGIAVATWRPDGGLASQFAVMRRFQPAPPAGIGDQFDWGREEHVEQLLGEAFELEFEDFDSPLVTESGEAAWELWSTSYGPTKTLAESLDEDRRDELHRAFVDLYESARVDGGIRYSREGLLVLGRRR